MTLEKGNQIELLLGTAYAPVERLQTRKNTAFRGDIETVGGRVATILKLLKVVDIVREVICWILARSLELPAPQAYLVYVDPAVVNGRYEGNPERIAFGSEETGRHRHLHGDEGEKLLRSWPLTIDCAVFDLWIHCTDRYPGNLIFDVNDEIYLIDHEEALPNFAHYELESNSTLFRILKEECSEFELHLMRGKADSFARECAKLDLNFLPEMIESKFPNSTVGSQIVRHVQFLDDRARILPDLIAKSLGLSQSSSSLNGNIREEKERYE